MSVANHWRSATGFIAFLASALCIASASPVYAQIKNCDGTTRWKIFLDDIRILPGADSTAALEGFRKRLATEIDRNLDEVVTDLRPKIRDSIEKFACPGRMPLPGAFLDTPLLRRMDRNGVVLEVWATVDSTVDNQGHPVYRAQHHYALVPLCSSPPTPNISGFIPLEDRIAPPAPFIDVTKGCRHAEMLEAYAYIGLGLQALSENHFDEAYSLINRGRCLLARAAPSADTSFTSKLMDRVVSLARSSSRESMLKHLTDANLALVCQ